jgi:GNAT superfamily N-acetyltransferase
MNLEFKPFHENHYAEYEAWFSDAALNHRLGPIDRDWFQAVIAQPQSEGETWAVFRDDQFVAVVDTVFDPNKQLPAGITAMAVKPTLRGKGIGTAVLQRLLDMHRERGIVEHVAYVSLDNPEAQHFLEMNGFRLFGKNDNGYNEFRYPAYKKSWMV